MLGGNFSGFQDRQKRSGHAKLYLRKKVERKQNKFRELSTYNSDDEFDLPKVSEEKLNQIKIEIRRKVKKEKITRIILTFIIIEIMVILIFIIYKYNIF